jgi:DHA1 family inner membrane transport protein
VSLDAGVGPGLIQRQFYGLSITAGLALGLTAPLTAVLAVELGATPFAAGISVASLTAVVFVMDIVGTRLLPFLEPRRAITRGMLLWAFGSFGSAVAPTFEIMAAARLVQGIGLAQYAAAAPQLAVKLAGTARVAQAMGRFQAAMTLGSAIGPLSGGLVTQVGGGTLGLRLAFAVCGVIALICAAWAWAVLPTTPSATKPRLSLPRLPGMGSSRALLGLLLGTSAQGLRGAITLTIVPLVAAEQLGMDIAWLGVFLTFMYVIEVVAMTSIGPLSDRRGRRTSMLAGSVCGGIGVVLILVAISTQSPVIFFLGALPLGVASGCMFSVTPAVLVDIAGTAEVGLSATRIARDLGFTIFTVGVGAVITASSASVALWSCVGAYGLVALLMIVIGETHRGGRSRRAVPG